MADKISLTKTQTREAAHFLPVVRRMPVVIVQGQGSRVSDQDGRELIDLTAGWGVNAIGHCHPALVETISNQAARLMQTTNLYYTTPQLDLMERLDRLTPAALTHSFFVSSGSEAVEGALKLVHRATGRAKFVSTDMSFHGRTLGALNVIGQEKHRTPYEALLPSATVIPLNDIEAAEAAIDGNTAAFIVEPIQGEGGVNLAQTEYLQAVRKFCDDKGALLIFDEIQTGLGRTGKMFALEHSDVTPDVLTLGKGLGGGVPIAGFMTTEAVAATVSLGDHGGTYAGNVLACAAANTVIRVIEEEGLVERAAKLGEKITQRFNRFITEHPALASETRGAGLLQGLVLSDAEKAAALPLAALEKGVLVNVTAGTVMRLFPALNIPEEDLWNALDILLDLIANGASAA
ncbi:MAG: aspartate aminotransferase family protein [Deltaproteobacteria bacterium]|nr:aspartate aminotransferase family protein [Deltaproteobacteria bacterium]